MQVGFSDGNHDQIRLWPAQSNRVQIIATIHRHDDMARLQEATGKYAPELAQTDHHHSFLHAFSPMGLRKL
jgi:hypothetical protein